MLDADEDAMREARYSQSIRSEDTEILADTINNEIVPALQPVDPI